MEKQLLIDFADWLWDMDRLKVTTQLPPFEKSGMMVEMFLKAKILNDQCEGKADQTSEKDLRVCEVVASAWISVEKQLPEIGQRVITFRPMAKESGDDELTIQLFTGSNNTSPQGVKHGFDRWCLYRLE